MEQPQDRQHGEYAGPLTRRAMDYNGNTVIGIPISDAAPDGSCFFITLDHHMQISVGSVLASSITPYDPPEPPPEPECIAAELAETRARLEYLLKMQLDHGITSIGDLRACALTMSDLADVIQQETRIQAPSDAGQQNTVANWPKIMQHVSGHATDDTIDPDYAEDVR